MPAAIRRIGRPSKSGSVPREVDGDERQQLWDEIVHAYAGYAEHAERTTRRIPMVLLEPTAGR